MRVLMLGWEFPPYFAGGVGTVCYELTRALTKSGVHVTYIMPNGPDNVTSDAVKLRVASREMQRIGAKIKVVKSSITPYVSKEEYQWQAQFGSIAKAKKKGALYGADLLMEMERFALAVCEMADEEDFDVIHAHDWTTIPAALALKRKFNKPVVLHVHITEFDKTGGEHADPEVYRIEHDGFHQADLVIAVSNFVKQRLIRQYYVDPDKIRVVYNSVESREVELVPERVGGDEKLVLFLGRVTLQKGPDYFLEAAAKVSHLMPNVKFIVAGTGDMLPRMIEKAAELGLGNRVIFPGFVTRDEGDKLYRMADLFVMPSVSEPFGIVPLEAMRMGTPVIVSRQSGVCEVLQNALKVDFWDTDDLAAKIVAALMYRPLHSELREHGYLEIQRYNWEAPAQRCVEVYEEARSRKVLVRT